MPPISPAPSRALIAQLRQIRLTQFANVPHYRGRGGCTFRKCTRPPSGADTLSESVSAPFVNLSPCPDGTACFLALPATTVGKLFERLSSHMCDESRYKQPQMWAPNLTRHCFHFLFSHINSHDASDFSRYPPYTQSLTASEYILGRLLFVRSLVPAEADRLLATGRSPCL